MKKTLLAAMMAAVMTAGFALAGCGAQETSAPAADSAVTAGDGAVEDSVAEENADAEDAAAEDAAESQAEEAADAEENGSAAENDGAGENAESSDNASKDAETDADDADSAAAGDADTFVFEYDGIQMYVNQEASDVLDALGEPTSYFEAASCAFEGLDKMYTYSSFEVDTYPEGDVDYISCIYFLDDLVETQEGVCLYMTQADMEAAYGTDYEEANGAYVYSKGNGELSFIIENDEIVAIEYKTKVDYD